MDEALAEAPRDIMREDPSLVTLEQEKELREATEPLSDDVTFEILLHSQSSMIHSELRWRHLHLLVTDTVKLTAESPFELLVALTDIKGCGHVYLRLYLAEWLVLKVLNHLLI